MGRYEYLRNQATKINKALKSKYSENDDEVLRSSVNHIPVKREGKQETRNIRDIVIESSSDGVEDADEMPFDLPEEHLKQLE